CRDYGKTCRMDVKTRAIELNVCQRCSAALISKTDQEEAVLAGRFAAASAIQGETGKMAAFTRKSDVPYKMECELKDVDQICNEEKTVPPEWITKEGSDVSDDFLAYVRPLTAGAIRITEDENGIADFLVR
ncbi:MAG: 6-phosphofructokinase, partial [Lachnospiraceae bacterium]|nr:6-phosphofructokinase [Lachnospiraceae bacterium]